MSNITTEKKELEQLTDIDLSFMFNSKVSSIVDDYLFNKETAKDGLKRKREPENIESKKSTKIDEITLRFYITYICFTHTQHQMLSPQNIKTIDRTMITNIYNDHDCYCYKLV